LSVAKLCNYLASAYDILNRDLLISAAILHDIAKVKEFSEFPMNDYTDDGQLLGHIVMGYEMVSERIEDIPGFPKKQASELKHCILAHHGELEFGSPKKPALIEAVALSFADNTDAKIETFKEDILKPSENEWRYSRFIESNIRKTTKNQD
ncbi:MAG: HD domain-containing protein, partial [Lachnospiraceae bacterium]|nr:HD domain-containing protein [Clostridiales bacterium]MDY5216529.1 HD domain-containing protein [Lachnospiraceae bacterium]